MVVLHPHQAQLVPAYTSGMFGERPPPFLEFRTIRRHSIREAYPVQTFTVSF